MGVQAEGQLCRKGGSEDGHKNLSVGLAGKMGTLRKTGVLGEAHTDTVGGEVQTH